MLVNKAIDAGEIAVVKTTTGAEIIGRVAEMRAEDGFVKLKQPLIVQPMQDQQGNLHLTMMPYSLTCEDSQTFQFTGEIFRPREDVKKGYMSQTSSLELPENNIILPK